MSQLGYLGQASLKARVKDIEERLANDESLLTFERQALLEEKTKLYDRLYPAEVEEDDE